MLSSELVVGKSYVAKISTGLTTVRLEKIEELGGVRRSATQYGRRSRVRYVCTNLKTGREVWLKSAMKFRREVKPDEQPPLKLSGNMRSIPLREEDRLTSAEAAAAESTRRLSPEEEEHLARQARQQRMAARKIGGFERPTTYAEDTKSPAESVGELVDAILRCVSKPETVRRISSECEDELQLIRISLSSIVCSHLQGMEMNRMAETDR